MEIEDSESQDQHHDGLCTCILLVQLQIINFKFNIVSFGIIAFIGPDSSIDNTENSMMGSLFEFQRKNINGEIGFKGPNLQLQIGKQSAVICGRP